VLCPQLLSERAPPPSLSASTRRLGRDPWSLTAEACLAAIAEPGVAPDDITGSPPTRAPRGPRRASPERASRTCVCCLAFPRVGTPPALSSLSPLAVYREPLTLDDYLQARMISDPLCLYDCDVPVDGSVAFVVSRAGAAAIDRSRVVAFAALGSAAGPEQAAQMMWSRTQLGPADVKLAQLYDGFSILTLLWMEALGLCPPLGAARFVEGGEHIDRTGRLPLNTGGGQLSGGRLHGYGQLLEACLQLRGEAGTRQVPGGPDVAAVSSGTASFSSSLLLTRGDR
jgi:hypothetical protein